MQAMTAPLYTTAAALQRGAPGTQHGARALDENRTRPLQCRIGRPTASALLPMSSPPLSLEEDFLVTAFNVARVGICFTDEHGYFVQANPAFCQMIGYQPEELIGRHYTLAAPASVLAEEQRFFKAVLHESPRVPLEWKVRKQNGEFLDALVRCKTITRDGGQRFLVITFTDITDLKRAEEELRESERRFRDIAENIPEVFWVTDPAKSEMLYVSPAYEVIWGRSVARLYAEPTSFVEAIHPEDRARVIAALARQTLGEYDVEYRVVRPDGSVRWVRDKAFPVRDARGRVYRVTGIATDITERKRSEEQVQNLHQELESRIADRTAELVAANERIRLLIETANDALVTMDACGRVEEWNRQAERQFGWSRDEAVGQQLSQLIIPERYREGHEAGLRRYMTDGSSNVLFKTLELHALDRDGREFPVEVSVWPVKTHERTAFSAFVRDISERKRHEAALAARAEQMRLHRNVLLELAQLDKSDFEPALERVLMLATETLRLDNVAYWTLAPDESAITCEMVYRTRMGGPDPAGRGRRFEAANHPTYFATIRARRPVIAGDAQNDPVLADFSPSYLVPAGITSVMDIGVWLQGRMVGLVCYNHVGPTREWTAEEIDFASAIANMVSLVLEGSNRQRLMDELTRSEQKYREVVENANESIMVAQSGHVLYANPRTTELFGYSLPELTARPFIEFLHPDDRGLVMERHVKRMRGEFVADNRYQFRVTHKQGDVRWVEISAVTMDWEGKPATLNFLSDITERRMLQEDLKSTLAEQETILESAVVGIAHLVKRQIKWLNTRLEQIFGYDKGELVGQDALMLYVDPQDNDRLAEQAIPVMRAGRSFEHEVRMRRKDGSHFWAFISGRAVDPGDLDQGSIWILTDISEAKELRESLTRTMREQEAILRSTLVGITFSVNRVHQWVNETFARMLGYAPEELIGRLSMVHFPDEASFRAFGSIAYPLLASGKPYSGEAQMKRKNGQLIWCQLYGQALDPSDLSKGTIWTFVDTTERKRAEEEVHRTLEKERELNELKSRFVSMTSHEFRTPLATILSSTELLEDYAERLPPEEKTELIGLIKSAVGRMAGMLDDVLTLGKADADRIEFDPQPVDLDQFCNRLADEIRQGNRNSHPLSFESRGERRTRRVDTRLLRHILTNLLDNAIKYSPPGRPVALSLDCRADASVFEIADQGIGIPPEDQARLFETFHRARNVRNVSGTGLGLAIVKRMVDLHGGTITFASAAGQGTRFVVSIPNHREG